MTLPHRLLVSMISWQIASIWQVFRDMIASLKSICLKKILSHSLVWVMTPINFWGMAWSLLRTGSNLLPYCLSSDHLEDKSYPCLLQGKLIDTPEKIQFTDYISFSGDYNQFGANIKILWTKPRKLWLCTFKGFWCSASCGNFSWILEEFLTYGT